MSLQIHTFNQLDTALAGLKMQTAEERKHNIFPQKYIQTSYHDFHLNVSQYHLNSWLQILEDDSYLCL